MVRKNKRTECVSIHKGWLMKTVYLWILFCIYMLDCCISFGLYIGISFLELFWQPAYLVKVWSVFWNHGHCLGKRNGLSFTGLWFFSPLSSAKWLYASKSWRKGRAISCITNVIQVSWVSLLSPYTAHPHQKPNSFSILETSGEESWVGDPRIPL